MSTTTVAELKAALGVGSLYPDATLQSVCDAADNALLPFLWKNDVPIIAHSSETATTGTLYFDQDIRDIFYVGQSVVIANSGTRYNGTKTITGVSQYSFTIAITSGTVNPYHEINPYGTASAETYTDYTAIPAVKQASLMVCVSIWTSRQTNSGNGMQPDGSMGNMYAMSSQLIARVRGLLSPYLDPRSLIG
jgi:hypothetical protein